MTERADEPTESQKLANERTHHTGESIAPVEESFETPTGGGVERETPARRSSEEPGVEQV